MLSYNIMNKKIFAIAVGIIMVAAVAFAVKNKNESVGKQDYASQVADIQGNVDNQSGEEEQAAEIVQVYLFHSTLRCSTCIAIGSLAGETVNEFFQPELQAGKIEFREINIDLPENKELAAKFQASGSALYVNAIVGGRDNIVQDTAVWRLTQDEVKFKSYLRGEINKRFKKII